MSKISMNCGNPREWSHYICSDETCRCFCHTPLFAPLEFETVLGESIKDNSKWDGIVFEKDDFWQKTN